MNRSLSSIPRHLICWSTAFRGPREQGSSQALVGNRGYRKYLKRQGPSFEIDEAKVAEEARYGRQVGAADESRSGARVISIT